MGLGCREQYPGALLSDPGPSFSVSVYLPWKRPCGPGRKRANSRRLAGLRNKEPHCARCLATPHPGPAKSPERGTSWGPGRKEAWGLRAASAPSPPARERASVQGWDGGRPSPHPASERMRRGCWAAAPRHGLGPTRHRPAGHRPASPGQREETRGAGWPWCPWLLLGRRHPSVEGHPALSLPSPVPAPARQLVRPQASLPGRSWRQESPAVRAWPWLTRPRLACGLMSSWGHLRGLTPPQPCTLPH